jgi:hypothetical protein
MNLERLHARYQHKIKYLCGVNRNFRNKRQKYRLNWKSYICNDQGTQTFSSQTIIQNLKFESEFRNMLLDQVWDADWSPQIAPANVREAQ